MQSCPQMAQPLSILHRKQLLADDKADLREIKERFLADGDLVEDGLFLKDGLFRKRKLARMGSEGSLDLFADDQTLDSGGEDVDEDSDELSELNRRRIRVEKEQYLRLVRVSAFAALTTDHVTTAPFSSIPVCVCVCTCRADRAACWMRMRRANRCSASSL